MQRQREDCKECGCIKLVDKDCGICLAVEARLEMWKSGLLDEPEGVKNWETLNGVNHVEMNMTEKIEEENPD